MSVELEVRLGTAIIAVQPLLASVAAELRTRLFARGGMDSPSLVVPRVVPPLLGNAPAAFLLSLEGAEAEIRCYSVGTEDELGEDGGWWVSFSAVNRSAETLYLLLLVAACFAELSGSRVADDALILKRGRWVEPDVIFALIGSGKGQSLEEATRRLRGSIAS